MTREQYNEMRELLADALINNVMFTNSIGMHVNVYEVFHTMTIEQLKKLWKNLTSKISTANNNNPEWGDNDTDVSNLVEQQKLVNLIILYRIYRQEVRNNQALKDKLTEELNAIVESTKSPEDRIKDLTTLIESLNTDKF